MESVGLDVAGEVVSVPPGLTAAERAAWARDGLFWRRGALSPADVAAAKRAVRGACSAAVAPLGMLTGPGARVFLSDDPTRPPEVLALATHPAVLGPLREIVGDNVDYLYTKAVWKDKDVETGFPWHWDNTYWGGAPKVSTWVALDDADEANGCLQLVPGSHAITAELKASFQASFRRQRADGEDPWLHRSGAPPTKGDDFAIAEAPLDAFLAPRGLRRETHPAKAGDVLFFSSFTLHASHRNQPGSKDRWALITTYRDATVPDASRVFPRPRPALRRGCAALGLAAAVLHATPPAELATRYILPAAPEYSAAAAALHAPH
jgi:ectoine hydroxylase-related dioxygenase (phytanoyl-CoA dioxygenase family)